MLFKCDEPQLKIYLEKYFPGIFIITNISGNFPGYQKMDLKNPRTIQDLLGKSGASVYQGKMQQP